ncbi:NLP effector protein 10 [Paramyrothecium foliicola]|nr:NLP effector protein 10 [Paramyrothecium foliicola]
MFFMPAVLAMIPGVVMASLIAPLPSNPTSGAVKWQPVLDFDKDVCYQTSAIAPDGTVNPGLPDHNKPKECRDADRLFWSNTYSREKCNNYWCAYMYGYYFERDPTTFAGHTHDWEHVIIWTLHDQVTYVSWSAHGDYTTERFERVRFEGNRAKIVVHHGSSSSSSMRLAKSGDDDIENHSGHWFLGPLVSYETMDGNLRNILMNHNFGSAHMDLKDARFNGALDAAMPWDARVNEKFDPHA